jgi:hypothetical protein
VFLHSSSPLVAPALLPVLFSFFLGIKLKSAGEFVHCAGSLARCAGGVARAPLEASRKPPARVLAGTILGRFTQAQAEARAQ